MLTRIKFISICFLFVLFMLWLISGEVKKTGENMRDRYITCDGYAYADNVPDFCK